MSLNLDSEPPNSYTFSIDLFRSSTSSSIIFKDDKMKRYIRKETSVLYANKKMSRKLWPRSSFFQLLLNLASRILLRILLLLEKIGLQLRIATIRHTRITFKQFLSTLSRISGVNSSLLHLRMYIPYIIVGCRVAQSYMYE